MFDRYNASSNLIPQLKSPNFPNVSDRSVMEPHFVEHLTSFMLLNLTSFLLYEFDLTLPGIYRDQEILLKS